MPGQADKGAGAVRPAARAAGLNPNRQSTSDPAVSRANPDTAPAMTAGFTQAIAPAEKTTRPSTIVVFTRPVSVLPFQGELADLLNPALAS